MEEVTLEIDLPGFRFHPTEEELLDFYLKSVASGKKLRFDIIGILNIYRHDPWDLPDLSKAGEREWYFFVPRERKHGNGRRPNRTTAKGFWKATGSDRTVISVSEPKRVIGSKKTLVFYMGRAPRGSKTDWIMNEYRLPDSCPLPKDLVLCKVYRKATSLKVLEQRAISEGERKVTMAQQETCHTSPPSPMSMETVSFSCQKQEGDPFGSICVPHLEFKIEAEDEGEVVVNLEENKVEGAEEKKGTSTSSIQMPLGVEPLAELQVPKVATMEWDQDPFGAQFTSPWLLNWVHHYANVLNFHV